MNPLLKKQGEAYIGLILKAEVEATGPPAAPYEIAL